MSSFRETLSQGEKRLKELGISEYRLDAWYLLEYTADISRSWYFAHMEETVEPVHLTKYRQLIEKRGRHVPLQHLTGRAYFMGLEFQVNPHVLVPRQDTEILVEQALEKLPPEGKILDMCTGSGCILLSLLYNRKRALGTGVDISPEALETARRNSRNLGIRADFLQSDLFQQVEGTFHMIVSNPPYIPTAVIDTLMEEVRDYEPRLALDGRGDGLYFYEKIVSQAGEYLEPGGWLFFEIGAEQGRAVSAMMERAGYGDVKVVTDLAGLDRVVYGFKKY